MRTVFPIAVIVLVLFALPGVAVFAADLLGYGREINRWLESRFSISHRLAVGLPAAIILFCIPPLIILLYFLRLRRKPQSVSSTYLWKKSIEDLHVNRLMQWLRRNLLMLMQLLIVMFCIYAVLGPRLHGSIFGGRHYILIIDHSASMSATDVAPSRLEWAKQQALREIDAATDDDIGMVIAFDSSAEIRQSYTNNRNELRLAVRNIEPTQKPTRIDEALSLASSLANPLKSTENESTVPGDVEPGKERQYVPTEGIPADVHLFSDGRFPMPADFALTNLNLTYHVPPASGSDNIAITRMMLDRGWMEPLPDDAENDPGDPTRIVRPEERDDPDRATVTVFVKNYRDRPTEALPVSLEILDGEGRLRNAYVRKVRPAANRDQAKSGKAIQFFIPNLPPDTEGILHARIEQAKDAFPIDDEYWMALGVSRKAKVLIITPDNNKLLRAFFESETHKSFTDVTWETPAALTDEKRYLNPAREGRYDLVIFDRCGPLTEPQMPNANTWFIGYAPPPFKMKKDDAGDNLSVIPVKGPQVQGSLKSDPIMRNLRGLEDIAIDESFQLPTIPNRTLRLLEASMGQVLIASLPRGAYMDLVMCFPLMTSPTDWNTLWPLDPSFVLFTRNLVKNLGNVRDAATDEPINPGNEQSIITGAVGQVRITKPDETDNVIERNARRPELIVTDTDQVGIYRVSWLEPGTGDTTRRLFAVNLSPTNEHDESDLQATNEIRIGAETVTSGTVRQQPRDLWKYVVVLGLLVVMLEWWFYNRRVQI